MIVENITVIDRKILTHLNLSVETGLKKVLSAFKPSEHLPSQEEKVSKRLGRNIGFRDKTLHVI